MKPWLAVHVPDDFILTASLSHRGNVLKSVNKQSTLDVDHVRQILITQKCYTNIVNTFSSNTASTIWPTIQCLTTAAFMNSRLPIKKILIIIAVISDKAFHVYSAAVDVCHPH